MSLTTARSVIDAARLRHWAFSHLEAGDGAALLFLTSRLRSHLATHGATIEGLVGTTLQYTVPLTAPAYLVTTTGSILATNYGQSITTNTGLGQPTVGAAYQDGWPIQLVGNVPFVDFSGPPIAADPFGTSGGTPGFPLPADMIRLTHVAAVYTNNQLIPIDVVPEAQRLRTLPGRNPAVFVAANRLVPIQPLASGNTGTRWDNVTAIQISYVGVQTLTDPDDVLNIPTVLTEALIADLACYFAALSKSIDKADVQRFEREAARCAASLKIAALDTLVEPQMTQVHYVGW